MDIFRTVKKIFDGVWNNHLFEKELLSTDETNEILHRRSICNACEYMLAGECGWCGCNIKLKTASLESECASKVDIKWKKFEKRQNTI